MNKYSDFSDWRRKRGCVRKKTYETKQLALKGLELSGKKTGGAYRCEFCGNWHITTSLLVKDSAA